MHSTLTVVPGRAESNVSNPSSTSIFAFGTDGGAGHGKSSEFSAKSKV